MRSFVVVRRRCPADQFYWLVTLFLALFVVLVVVLFHLCEHLVVIDAFGVVILDVAFFTVSNHHAPTVIGEWANVSGEEHAERFLARRIAPGFDQNFLCLIAIEITKVVGHVQRGDAVAKRNRAVLIFQLRFEFFVGH